MPSPRQEITYSDAQEEALRKNLRTGAAIGAGFALTCSAYNFWQAPPELDSASLGKWVGLDSFFVMCTTFGFAFTYAMIKGSMCPEQGKTAENAPQPINRKRTRSEDEIEAPFIPESKNNKESFSKLHQNAFNTVMRKVPSMIIEGEEPHDEEQGKKMTRS